MTKTMTKQDKIERVLRNNGTKGFNIKQLAFYAKVSTKTFRTRCSKMKNAKVINYSIDKGSVNVTFL